MSELIRQGIEKANVDLKKENDQKLMQQVFILQFYNILQWFTL